MNTITDIKRYLSDGENPPDNAEFMEFWNSLSDEEKDEFRNTPLPQE